MAMNSATLGPAIASAVASLSEAEKANPAIIWTKVADEIIKHIQTTGVVNTTGTAAAQTGTIT